MTARIFLSKRVAGAPPQFPVPTHSRPGTHAERARAEIALCEHGFMLDQAIRAVDDLHRVGLRFHEILADRLVTAIRMQETAA